MRRVIATILVPCILLFGAPGFANAGPFEDGLAAFNRADYPTARRLWEALAKQGNPSGQAWLGLLYVRGDAVPQDVAEAVRLFRLAAAQGNPSGQCFLGQMHDDYGKGVPKSYAEAVKWYRLGADQGDARCQWLLGGMYNAGQGVPQSYATAVKWYRLAAAQGFPSGQWVLGTMFEHGWGVPQSYVLAHMWYNLAGAATPSDIATPPPEVSAGYRDRIASKMTASQIAEAQRLAAEWKPK